MEGDCRWLQSNALAFALKNNQLAKKQAVVGASDVRLSFGVSGSGGLVYCTLLVLLTQVLWMILNTCGGLLPVGNNEKNGESKRESRKRRVESLCCHQMEQWTLEDGKGLESRRAS